MFLIEHHTSASSNGHAPTPMYVRHLASLSYLAATRISGGRSCVSTGDEAVRPFTVVRVRKARVVQHTTGHFFLHVADVARKRYLVTWTAWASEGQVISAESDRKQ